MLQRARPSGVLKELLFVGIVCVVWNWLLWRRDIAQATALRTKRLSQPLPELGRTDQVSALVAAWNAEEHIEALIRSFLMLDYPNLELILCAGGTDNTFCCASRFASNRITVLKQHPGEGKQRALVRCLECASGEILYLTDADCVFDNEAFTRMLDLLSTKKEEVVTGSLRPHDHQLQQRLPFYLWASDVVAAQHRSTNSRGLLGMNTMLTRAALERGGGLNYLARTGTDYHLARRLINSGATIRYVPTSIVPTHYPVTLQEHSRRQSRWLRNLLIYGLQYKSWYDVIATIRTVGAGLLMTISPIVFAYFKPVLLLGWLIVFAHAVLSKLRYMAFTARLYQCRIPGTMWISVVPLTIIDFIIWTLPLLDLVNAKRRYRW
ncbi:MAG: hypothetical protein NVS2B7_28220 [Herpetosiphon sp.]